jgi:predicted dehydrogenase
MVRIGIIGAGPNAVGHARYYKESPRTEVIAIADPNTERATLLAEEVGAKALTDYTDFLDSVDAVVVSSPNFLHQEHAVACANAGKHLYCEKPMGLNRSEAGEIAEAVQRAGVASTVGFAVRFSPQIQTMLRLQQEGYFGELVSLCSRRLHWIPRENRPSWRNDARLCGGLLFEINIHEIEWMMALGGAVESVYARIWSAPESLLASGNSERTNDHLWVTLNFAGSTVGTHEGSWLSPLQQFYRSAIGTDGAMQTDEWGNALYWARPGEKRTVCEELSPAFDLRGHFLDCIEGVASPTADVHWGYTVTTVADAILESARTGGVVSLQ